MRFRSPFPFLFSLTLALGSCARLSTPPQGGSLPEGAGRAEYQLSAGQSVEGRIAGVQPGQVLSLTVALHGLTGDQDEVYFTLKAPDGAQAKKTLHAGDPDFYFPAGINASGEATYSLTRKLGGGGEVIARLNWRPWTQEKEGVILESEPNNTWKQANPIMIGRTVQGSGDDAAYILHLGAKAEELGDDLREQTSHAEQIVGLYQQDASVARSLRGLQFATLVSNLYRSIDWYRLDFAGPEPRLVMFGIELLDRDNLPCDVAVFRLEGDGIKPYDEGIDPVSPPHEVQALPGNKFTTRVLRQGTYYLRVVPNHPDYQLWTRDYPVPPYDDPRKAVRAGMDYIIAAGDSWHANTPRVGGLVERVGDVHAETQQCIACHPTQFSFRAEMTAARNGYPINMRSQVAFLADRFYNNPRPLYGQKDTTWSRMISAAANVSSRPAGMLMDFENVVNGDERLEFHKPIANYLRLYYKGRDKLPANESNGNFPLVSTYEVASYSREVFQGLFDRANDPAYRTDAGQMETILQESAIKDPIDLCWQTVALAKADREKYAEAIRANADRILSIQRPSGLWSAVFEADGQEVEFQTGHALYALALAGVPADDPRVARGIKALLERQRPFGGWFDPTQAYENFRTPFRETQFAVMALAQYFPLNETKKRVGWDNGSAPGQLTPDRPALLIDQLDRIWSRDQIPGKEHEKAVIHDATRDDEPMVRLAAVTCLGRIGNESDVPVLTARLGDETKMVQRGAAWALRQLASRKNIGLEAIASALRSDDERVRWGATRVLFRHFRSFSADPAIFEALLAGLDDPSPTVRLQASKSLSQSWYWSWDRERQRRIERALIAHMGSETHPWPARGLRESFHNVLDENTRYLYNNWIPLMAREEDRKRSIEAHHALVREQADLVASTLAEGDAARVKELLRSIAEFHLREGNYTAQGKYTRIGNDVEEIEFFPDATATLVKAIAPYLESPSPEVRELAVRSTHAMRGTKAPDLALSLLARLDDEAEPVRAAAWDFRKDLPAKIGPENRADALALLDRLLSSAHTEASAGGTELAAQWAKDLPETAAILVRLIEKGDARQKATALRAAEPFSAIQTDPAFIRLLAASLDASRPEALASALPLALKPGGLSENAEVRGRLEKLFASPDSETRRRMLPMIDERIAGDERVVGLVTASLGDPAPDVRRLALDEIAGSKKLKANPKIASAIRRIADDPQPLVRVAARSAIGRKDNPLPSPREALDFRFFVERVQPRLATLGPDGNSCVQCHITHTAFKLTPPDAGGRFTPEQSQNNFASALKVVDLESPGNSLILRKPMTTARSEGVAGSSLLSHGGGRRWADTNDEGYQTLLRWTRGATLPEGGAAGGGGS